MPVKQKFFPSQEPGERVFLLIRKHWFNYVTFFFLSFLAVVPVFIAIYIWINNPTIITPDNGQILIIILAIFVLTILAVQLYGFVDYYLDVYIVTDQRIVDISQEGFFNRQISELHLHQVQDVNARVVGFWQTMFHFGDVHIQTAAERENFIFKAIPHPYLVAKQIIKLHEAHIERTNRRIVKKDNSKEYQEGEEEYDLPFMDLEKQAKTILKKSNLLDRVKYGGMVMVEDGDIERDITPKKSPTTKGKDINSKKETKAKIKSSGKQGELMEGREIELQ